jgi:xylulokinase
MEYVIGLDIGSSAAKVGLFGLDGSVAALAGCPYPTYEPRPGYKEQDAADWWRAAAGAIREVMAEAPAGSILALGAVGHISSLTFLDDAHAPIRRSLGFQDVRAAAEVSELHASFSREELGRQLGIDLPPGPTWPLPRLIWFRRHEPATTERARVLLQAKDYVNLRLTGVVASDASSNRGMVNLATGRAPERIFRTLRLPDLLPRIHEPHAVIGVVTAEAAAETGLRPGLPVVAGWNDLNGAVLGSGAVDPGDGFNVTGTSEHIGVVTDSVLRAPELICGPYLPGRKLFYGVTSCGGGSLEWFRQFTGRPLEQLLAETERAGAGALLFLPYLEGERAPVWDPRASGALVGLRSSHGQGAVARAIMEGVAFSLRQNLEIVERSFSCGGRLLAISGGGSRIALWNQTKADVLARPVVTLQNPHAGMLGAAMLAAAGAGVQGSPEGAARRMARPGCRYDPRPEASQRCARLYAQYRELYPALRGVFAALDEERNL